MKFLETHFEEYINSKNNTNLHIKLTNLIDKMPNELNNLPNLIFYGPSGVGKYSQMLYMIKKYSPSQLKYEKKISVTYDKKQYYFKISDTHYEIDMSLLGCNSKLLWHEIYQQILDILSAKTTKTGIIVCKNFHNIHTELLENFYSYIQDNKFSSVCIKYILLTEELCFIPEPIINCCEIIPVNRPTKVAYNKCLQLSIATKTNKNNKCSLVEKCEGIKAKMQNNIKVENITNIKYLHTNTIELMSSHKIICDKILKEIKNIESLVFLKFRDMLYDIFIFDLNITHCIWYIIVELIKDNYIKNDDFSNILKKTYNFFKYYNNNYRPIYHLENYLLYLTSVIHGYK
jgi:hypothetical protein